MTQNICYMVVASGGEYDGSYSYTMEVSLDKTVAELRALELQERHEKLKRLVHELQQRFNTWQQENRRPDYRDFPRETPPRNTKKQLKADPQLKAKYDAAVVINVKSNADYLEALGAWNAQWYPHYCDVCKSHDIDPLPFTPENHYKITGHGFDDTTEYSVETAPMIG